jgi:hypothetical protein
MKQTDDKAKHRYRYVITQLVNHGLPVSAVLRTHPEVTIIHELDASTALVEMSDEMSRQLAREFPDLAVEPNLQYRLSTR